MTKELYKNIENKVPWTSVFPEAVSRTGRVKRGISKELKTKIWLYRCIMRYDNLYSYPEDFIFTSSKQKVNIICPKHGPVAALTGSHVNGNGCKKCYWERKQKI